MGLQEEKLEGNLPEVTCIQKAETAQKAEE